jgi:hypothetical protein
MSRRTGHEPLGLGDQEISPPTSPPSPPPESPSPSSPENKEFGLELVSEASYAVKVVSPWKYLSFTQLEIQSETCQQSQFILHSKQQAAPVLHRGYCQIRNMPAVTRVLQCHVGYPAPR